MSVSWLTGRVTAQQGREVCRSGWAASKCTGVAAQQRQAVSSPFLGLWRKSRVGLCMGGNKSGWALRHNIALY